MKFSAKFGTESMIFRKNWSRDDQMCPTRSLDITNDQRDYDKVPATHEA